MAFKKLLFPPLTPPSLPAFDKTKKLRFYFRPSKANSMSQVGHLQMTIVRMDTNRSALNKNEYPLDILFRRKEEIFEDTEKKYYYVDIPASIFPLSDVVYKIQIRLGEDDISGFTSSSDLGAWLKLPETLDRLSEWSSVTIVMPITAPDFGVQGFEPGTINKINTDGFVFQGYYYPQDELKQEYITSYRYNLYTYTDESDMSTWKLLSSSGEKYVTEFQQVNMDFVFSYELVENTNYIVTLTIKTKNLFVDTIVYKTVTDYYPILEFFNVLELAPNAEEAKNDLIITAKQILIKVEDGSAVTFIKDEPGHENYPELIATHAKIDGKVYANKGFSASPIGGKNIIQFKTIFTKTFDSLSGLYSNPTILLTEKPKDLTTKDSFARIKIGVQKINIAYPTSSNLNPAPEWEYRAIIRKEIVIGAGVVEQVILSQNKVVRLPGFTNKTEYYFYIEENNGLMDVVYDVTYVSTHPEI